MAPEQVRGQNVDHRADIFAFGAMLYELLSGRRPFSATPDVQVERRFSRRNRPTCRPASDGEFPPRSRASSIAAGEESGGSVSVDERPGVCAGRIVEPLGLQRSQRRDPARVPVARRRFASVMALAAVLALLGVLPIAVSHLREAPADRSAVRFTIGAPEGAMFSRWAESG